MKIEFHEPVRNDRFGLGWARRVKVNGIEYSVTVRPGKRVRFAFSNKYGYHWYAIVYRNVSPGGGEVATLPCDKSTGVTPIIEEALYREFCARAWGKNFADIEGMMHDRAFPRGNVSRSMDSPERKALDTLRSLWRNR